MSSYVSDVSGESGEGLAPWMENLVPGGAAVEVSCTPLVCCQPDNPSVVLDARGPTACNVAPVFSAIAIFAAVGLSNGLSEEKGVSIVLQIADK